MSSKYAFNYYLQKGVAPHIAAAIVGNLNVESGFSKDVISGQRRGDKGTAFGAAQWRGSRLRGLEKFALGRGSQLTGLEKFAQGRGTKKTDLDTQLDYVLHEMKTGSDKGASRAWKLMHQTDDPGRAAQIFMKHYERPSSNPNINHVSRRVAGARDLIRLGAFPAATGGKLAGGEVVAQVQFDPVSAGAVPFDSESVSTGQPQTQGDGQNPVQQMPMMEFTPIGGDFDPVAAGAVLFEENTAPENQFPPQGSEPGDVLPMSADGQGGLQFDSNAGIVGAVKRGFNLPGEILSGETVLQDPNSGAFNPAFADLVGTALPVAPAIRGAKSAIGAVKRGAPDETAGRIQAAKEHGIGLSQGQAQRTQKLQAQEQDILTGGGGEGAQKILQEQRTIQGEQVNNASIGLRDNLAPGTVETANEAGVIVGEAITSRAQTIKESSQRGFKAVEQSNAEVPATAMSGLKNKVFSKLEEMGVNEGEGIAPDMPAVRRLYKRIFELSDLKNVPKDWNVTGVRWGAIQNVRSQLVKQGQGGDAQAAAIREMRKGLDEWVDDVVSQNLVSGDQNAIKVLKKARSLWKDYKGIVNSPNAAVRRIAKGDLDGNQIANLIVGTSQVGNRTNGAAIVREIRKVLGDNVQPLDEIKRGMMNRLFKNTAEGTNKSYGKLASDISRFTDDEAPELARELFGVEGIIKLREFGQVLRTLTPDSLSTNPSRSGQTVARRFREFVIRAAPILGFAAGDLSGALGGLALKPILNRSSVKAARKLAAPAIPKAPVQVKPESVPLSRLAVPGALLTGTE